MQEILPKVTVITITYNLIKAGRKEMFLQCVESVKNQTYRNIEHIIIDGVSTDGTLKLIQSTGLQYYSEPDKGIYDAMNKGIVKATGKYIAFLNSDDFWFGENGVEESVKALEENNADFSYADCIYVDQQANFVGYLQAQIGAFFNRMPCSHQTMFFRISKLKEVGNYNICYHNASDYDLTLKLIYAKAKVVYVENLFCIYRTGGYSHSSNIESANECAMILKSYYNNFLTHHVDYLRMYLEVISPIDLCKKIMQFSIDDSVYYPMLQVIKAAIEKNNELHLTTHPRILDCYYPKVTVITITYNLIKTGRKETFLQCVESVKNQTYRNIEHIIIDGVSTDGTLELIQSTSLQYYSEPVKDYDAMNKGIEKASGKYIAFLNSNDFWFGENGVEESVKALEESGADFSYANCLFLSEKNDVLGEFHSILSCFPVHMPICHQTMFLKLSVLKNRKGFDTSFQSAANYDLVIDLLLKGFYAVEVPCNFTAYRLGGIPQSDEINHSEILKLYNKNFSKFKNYDETQAESMFFNKTINSALHDEIISKVHSSLGESMKTNNSSLSDRNIQVTQMPFLDSKVQTYPSRLSSCSNIGFSTERKHFNISHNKELAMQTADSKTYNLFGIPIFKIKQESNKTKYSLLGIPAFEIRKYPGIRRVYLFGAIQVLKAEKQGRQIKINFLGFIKFCYTKKTDKFQVLFDRVTQASTELKSSIQEVKQDVLKSQNEMYNNTTQRLEKAFELLSLDYGKVLSNQQKDIVSTDLNDYEFKIFSQFGDDGIIQYLIKNIHIENNIFIEFGVENYLESNTRFLLMNNNWRGFIMDGSEEAIQSLKTHEWFWQYNLTTKAVFIDKDNINYLLAETGFADIGLLHIDLDGNDYWIFEILDLTKLNPSIVILEYNSVFGKDKAITVPYDNKFYRTEKHYSNLYFGASLKALELLAKSKGYSLIGSNKAGNNAYFIRNDLLNDKIKATSYEKAYVLSEFRESRNELGELTYLAGDERLKALQGLPVINVETMETVYI